MLLLGVAGGVWLSVHRARRMGLDPEVIYSLGFWMFLLGIIGARLFYVVEYWATQFQKPTLGETVLAIINVAQGGLVVYGSAFGAGLALLLFVRKHRLPGLALADLIAPSLMVGLAFGRIGCFLNGCCYGGLCTLPWAVEFPAGSPPHVRQVEQGLAYGLELSSEPASQQQKSAAIINKVTPDSSASKQGVNVGDRILSIDGREVHGAREVAPRLWEDFSAGKPIAMLLQHDSQPPQLVRLTPEPSLLEYSLPVHPAQLYSTLDAALICLFLLAYYPFRRRDGELLALLFTIYPVTRYLIEIIRTDEAGMFGTQLSISQIVSLLVLAAVAAFWIYLLRRPRGVVLGNWQVAG
jgi:phosphatidylglycerol:prolipoprotein diacylglycerol transferase